LRGELDTLYPPTQQYLRRQTYQVDCRCRYAWKRRHVGDRKQRGDHVIDDIGSRRDVTGVCEPDVRPGAARTEAEHPLPDGVLGAWTACDNDACRSRAGNRAARTRIDD
jgi:hypothetical protein